MKNKMTYTEAIKYIQELERKTRKFEEIRMLFDKLRHGEIDEFDFSDQVIEILEQ